MREVNLLKAYITKTANHVRVVTNPFLSSLVILVAYCLMVASVFSYWLIVRKDSQWLDKRLADQKQRVEAFEKTESVYLLVKQKLSALAPFLAEESCPEIGCHPERQLFFRRMT